MTLFYPQTLKEFITTQIFIHQNSCQQANIQLFISFQKYNQIAACAKGIKIAQIALKSNSPNQPRAVKLHSVTLSLAFGRYKTNYTGTKCSEHLILVLNVFKKKKFQGYFMLKEYCCSSAYLAFSRPWIQSSTPKENKS